MNKALIILFLVSFQSYSQQNDWDKTLGYYCGFSGSGTPAVKKVDGLLFKKDYKALAALLYTQNPAENFLAVIVCKRLEHEKRLKLTGKDSKRISELFKSNEIVFTCGGCTQHGKIKLKDLLSSKEDVFETIEYYFGNHE